MLALISFFLIISFDKLKPQGKRKLLKHHHSSGRVLVSPNHLGGSNPDPPDKLSTTKFILQGTYIHIYFIPKS